MPLIHEDDPPDDEPGADDGLDWYRPDWRDGDFYLPHYEPFLDDPEEELEEEDAE